MAEKGIKRKHESDSESSESDNDSENGDLNQEQIYMDIVKCVPPNFFLWICGGPGSGKTRTMVACMANGIIPIKEFDVIYYFVRHTPNGFQSGTVKQVKLANTDNSNTNERVSKENDEGFNAILTLCKKFKTKLVLKTTYPAIVSTMGAIEKDTSKTASLIIVDDMLATLSDREKQIFISFRQQVSRHKNASMVIVSHDVVKGKVEKAFRSMATNIFLFPRLNNMSGYSKYLKDVIGPDTANLLQAYKDKEEEYDCPALYVLLSNQAAETIRKYNFISPYFITGFIEGDAPFELSFDPLYVM